MKTRILKKIRHRFNDKYRFEETFERDENGKTIPLYRVCDLFWDSESSYYVIKSGNSKNEIKKHYIGLYRKCVFDILDEYYSKFNKKPKSVRQMQNDTSIKPVNVKTYNNNKIKI